VSTVGLIELEILVPTFELCNAPWRNGLSENFVGVMGSGA